VGREGFLAGGADGNGDQRGFFRRLALAAAAVESADASALRSRISLSRTLAEIPVALSHPFVSAMTYLVRSTFRSCSHLVNMYA
jgi:hypothetical protein